MIKAFLSHSSSDKESYVNIVANKLGKQNIHYDEFTFEYGEKTITEIFKGIDRSELFVFFISNESLNSEWVKKEIFFAKNNLDRYELKKIYPIIIDNTVTHKDARIPDWIRQEYNLKLISKPSIAANKIWQKLIELSWDIHPILKKRNTLFVGRNDKLEEFEQRIDDFNKNKPKSIIVSGIPGVGRRTFLKNALVKTTTYDQSYAPLSIYLDRNDSIEDFIFKLNDLSISDIDDDLSNMLTKSIDQKVVMTCPR